MKTLYAVVLALASTLAFGQSPYVKVTTNNGTVTLKNTSGQGIVLIVGNITLNGHNVVNPDTKGPGQFSHEFFFDEGGFAAGDSMDWETKAPQEPRAFNYSIVPTFVQFDDGTTWGTRDSRVDSVIASRTLKIAYLRKLTESASFTAALNEKTANPAEADAQRRVKDWIDGVGMGVPAAMARVKQLLATGTARQNSGKF